jgi:hypothetical protein
MQACCPPRPPQLPRFERLCPVSPLRARNGSAAYASYAFRGFFDIGTNNGADDCMGVLLLTPMSDEDFLAG